jgi:2-(1,2-epoxy-1,2-dihydrophenyl)acetyl-CoA isomerase
MTEEGVDYSEQDGLAIIRIDRPAQLNAVDLVTAKRLRETVMRAERNDAVRCVLLTGAGKHFSAGGDVRYFHASLDLSLEQRRGVFEDILHELNDTIPRLMRMPKPVIASARGAVAGLGVSLVAACDIAMAASDAVFSMAYCAIGGVPDSGASLAISRLSNPKRAAELTLTGERFDAEEALRLGLLSRVVAPEALDEATQALCARLAAGPTRALAATKRLLQDAREATLESQLSRERTAFVDCVATRDFAEGLRAFVARRPAVFTGS